MLVPIEFEDTQRKVGLIHMDTLLEQVLASPELPLYLEKIQETVAKERQLRRRLYEEMTEDEDWEFINGEIVLHSPSSAIHISVRKRLCQLLDNDVCVHELGAVYDERTMISLRRNDYEPDICFFGPEKARTIQPTTLRFAAPDFIAEILSPSTEKHDRGVKFEDYAAHGALPSR